MTPQFLSERDLELISAYLDGEVNAREKISIEQRLAQDTQFKLAYEQLLTTRKLLRSQAQLRAPRNYTLSLESAPTVQRFGWGWIAFPALLRTASALASILFVVLFALNWFSMGRMMSAAPQPAGEVFFQASAPEGVDEQPPLSRIAPSEEQPMAKGLATAAPTPEIIYPSSSAVGGMGGGEGEGEGVIEAPLLEPYSGTLLIPSTETVTSTLSLPTPEGVGEMALESEAASPDEPLAQMQASPEGEETGLTGVEVPHAWLIKQILYGLLAISFGVFALRFGKRRL